MTAHEGLGMDFKNSYTARSRRVRRFNRCFKLGMMRYQCAAIAGISEPSLIHRLWRDNMKSENGGNFYD